MSGRLPRRGNWMGHEGGYICGRGWVSHEEYKTWFRSLVTDEAGTSVVVKEKAGPLVVDSQEEGQTDLRKAEGVEER